MPQLSKRQAKRQRKQQRPHGSHNNKPIVPGGPFLHKERVVLTGVQTLSGDSNGGIFWALVNGNGLATSADTTPRVPQEQLWNQYAAMYEYYQVKKISFKYVPYRFQGHGAVNQITVFNNYNIIQPDDAPALVNSSVDREGLFSFGNCVMHQGYQHVSRKLSDYTNLAISKQNEIILQTKGTAAQSQKYVKPASLGFYGQANDFGTAPQGEIQFSLEYVFSGMKRPGVQLAQGYSFSNLGELERFISQPAPQEQIRQPLPIQPEEGLRIAELRKLLAAELQIPSKE